MRLDHLLSKGNGSGAARRGGRGRRRLRHGDREVGQADDAEIQLGQAFRMGPRSMAADVTLGAAHRLHCLI